ncbi:MAG: hypothetical protein Q4P33_01440 [Flaviflexus sp.]|nr:hypothetical protein [Flaviflexus sp.]
MSKIVSTEIPVVGVRTDDDVRRCLQALFDVFTELGIGQATFEVTGTHTRLFIKHEDAIVPALGKINEALGRAGDYAIDPAALSDE